MARTKIGQLLPALLLAACSAGGSDGATSPPPPARAVNGVTLDEVCCSLALPGFGRSYRVEVLDAWGDHLEPDSVRVVSSNESVAVVSGEWIDSVRYADGRAYRFKTVRVSLIAPGRATLSATIAGHVATSEIEVLPSPPTVDAVIVDTFEVAEFPNACWERRGCAYVPLLRLRAPEGNVPVAVEAFEVTIPGQTSGWCGGGSALSIGPGTSVHLVPIDPYLWSNDVVFIVADSLAGGEVPATARVLLRDANGQLGVVSVTTRIKRKGEESHLPWGRPVGWDCVR